MKNNEKPLSFECNLSYLLLHVQIGHCMSLSLLLSVITPWLTIVHGHIFLGRPARLRSKRPKRVPPGLQAWLLRIYKLVILEILRLLVPSFVLRVRCRKVKDEMCRGNELFDVTRMYCSRFFVFCFSTFTLCCVAVWKILSLRLVLSLIAVSCPCPHVTGATNALDAAFCTNTRTVACKIGCSA